MDVKALKEILSPLSDNMTVYIVNENVGTEATFTEVFSDPDVCGQPTIIIGSPSPYPPPGFYWFKKWVKVASTWTTAKEG